MKDRSFLVFSLAIVILSFCSCKTQNIYMKDDRNLDEALDSAFIVPDDYQYRVRKDDKLTISLWGQDAVSVGSTYGIYNSNEVYGKWLMVDANGNIPLPKIGNFKAEGRTMIELRDTLTSLYAAWIRNPVVDVKVLNREVTVLGEVRNPRTVLLDKEKNNLLEIIAKCSGFDSYANLKYIKILRQKGPDVVVSTVDLTAKRETSKASLALLAGDVIIVPSKKYKEFDRRVSVIIPFATTMTAAAIFIGLF